MQTTREPCPACKTGQPARLVFELQNALSFLSVFKVKCVKNHYMSKADTTSRSHDRSLCWARQRPSCVNGTLRRKASP
jgi:hypothetical protein